MRKEHISDALQMLNDDIIEDTNRVRATRRKKRVLPGWCAAAACLILLVGGTVLLRQTHDGRKMIRHYDSVSDGCYATPGNGEVMYEIAVREARDNYSGKDVTYLLAFTVFENGETISSEKKEEEYRRLISSGYELYLAEYWTYQGKGEKKYGTVVVGYFTEEQLTLFKGNPDYGYFFYFAENGDSSPISVKQDDRITEYATNHS